MVVTTDGEEKPVPDLSEAMNAAIGSGGSVVLRNHDPLRLSAAKQPISLLTAGWLRIRAGEGTNPVLIVDMRGANPLLTVGARMNLTLEGLTIVARYDDQAPGTSPAPVIKSAGPARLSHCTFKVEHGSNPAGSRAVVSDGGDLTVEDCFFAGFATALEVHSIGGKTTTLRQSMIVPVAGRPSPSAPPDTPAWGLRMEFMSGGQASSTRRLILDHCTVVGSGFLQLAGFSPQHPLRVEPGAPPCRPRPWCPGSPRRDAARSDDGAMVGSGESPRHYHPLMDRHVRRHDALADQGDHRPGELVEGCRRGGAIRGRIRFATSPASRPATTQPGDFAIDAPGPLKAGADPDRVGPKKAARPPRPSA